MDNQILKIKVGATGASLLVAYLLWWFLGWLGAHRFYLGRTKSAVAQLLLFVIGSALAILLVGYPLLIIWAIWWGLDVILVYQIAKENRQMGDGLFPTITVTKSGGIYNDLDRLNKLHELYKKGVISRQEYEEKRKGFLWKDTDNF